MFLVEILRKLLGQPPQLMRGEHRVISTPQPVIGAESSALSSDIYEYLNSCFTRSAHIPESVAADWNQIRLLVDQQANLSENVALENQTQYFAEKLDRSLLIVERLSSFREKYAEYMGEKDIQIFSQYLRLSEANVSDSRARILLNKGCVVRNSSKSLSAFRDGIKHYSESVPVLIKAHLALLKRNKFSQDDFDLYLIKTRSLCIEILEAADATLSAQPRIRPKDVQKRNEIERIIKALFWDISQTSQGKEPLDYLLTKIDGFNVALDGQSAEAKAIKRIRNPLPEDQWETAYKPGDKIDVDALDAELRACGYID